MLTPENLHMLRHHPDPEIADTEAQQTILYLLDHIDKQAKQIAELERDRERHAPLGSRDYWSQEYVITRASWQLREEHNTQMAACGAIIGTLEARLARIAALVKPVPVADLVKAGTEAPALLAQRQRQIRAILEEEG